MAASRAEKLAIGELRPAVALYRVCCDAGTIRTTANRAAEELRRWTRDWLGGTLGRVTAEIIADGGRIVQKPWEWNCSTQSRLIGSCQHDQVAQDRVTGVVVEITDRFLRVTGHLRTYKIHLGSGNTLMEPNDAYLCIVAARDVDAERVFLPFEEDGGLLSVITDPSITHQIRG
ncbi:MAG TPA: hypothetical protein VFA45_12640 [Actinomycetes bacterium]|jgi:hypothetical protein|nr:hypothetical protein [Actinomycetes bacterium]